MIRDTSGRASDEPMVSFPPLMRQMLYGIIFGMPLLAAIGNWWCSHPGGAGTRAVLAVAQAICPAPGAARKHASVGDGAHALDRAVLHRVSNLLVHASGASVTSVARLKMLRCEHGDWWTARWSATDQPGGR